MENNNFWQTERGKALIKLGAWMIFIVALIIFVLVSERNADDNILDDPNNNEVNNNEPTETYEFALFSEMIENLINGNYEYSYKITNNNINYIYNGTKCNNEELGYRETSEGIIKYYQNDINTYQVILNEYVPIANLYEGIDTNFINLDILFNNLNEYLYNTEKEEDVRVITYDKDGYKVAITTDLENITNISITTETSSYDLDFNVVSTCDLGVLSE